MTDTTPTAYPAEPTVTPDVSAVAEADTSAGGAPAARPVYAIPLPRRQGDIMMHPPSDAQWAVFARMLQQIDIAADWTNREPDARERRLIQRAVGNTLAILDDCMAGEAAKELADRMLVDGRLAPEEAMALLVQVAKEHGMTLQSSAAPTNGPVQLRR